MGQKNRRGGRQQAEDKREGRREGGRREARIAGVGALGKRQGR